MGNGGEVVAIILAAGVGERWRDYLGGPKHFAPIDGERVLDRAVRLFSNHCSNIWVVGNDERYAIDGTRLYIPRLEPANFGADKFLSSEDLWSEHGRTVVLFGDVYFTENAVSTIMGFEKREWVVFGRFGRSFRTGAGYGELFAQSFWPEHIERHRAALQHLIDLSGGALLPGGSGWHQYHIMNGGADSEIQRKRRFGNLIEINDWTDDFDSPRDYDTFVRRRRPFGLLHPPPYVRKRFRARYRRARRAVEAIRSRRHRS